MQSRLATARLALAVAIVTSGNIADVNARPMHADIIPKYHRYLKEKEHVNTELDIWLEQYGPMGKKNGFIPVTESRSLDDVREDQLQRFYMTKEQINEARTANPMAEFTTDGPLTLMTMDEFKEFLLNSHVSDNNEGADSKKKRRKAAFGRVRNSTLSEGENLESNTSNTKSRSSSNDDESKAWDPAPGESKGDTTTRRLHASESSQYSYSWSGYNTNGQQGQQNDVDTQVQTQRNVQTNTGNDDRETNQGLNFHDISTGDSAQIGAVSSADSGNWNWWGANGWGLYGLGGNSLWWSGPSWWSDIKKPGDAQSNQPYHNQWSSWFYNQPTYPSTADTSLAAESLQAPTNPDTTDDATNVPLTRQKEDVKSLPTPAPPAFAPAAPVPSPAAPAIVPVSPVPAVQVPVPAVQVPVPAVQVPVPAVPVPAPAVRVPVPAVPVPAPAKDTPIQPKRADFYSALNTPSISAETQASTADGSGRSSMHKIAESTTSTTDAPKTIDWSTSSCIKPPDLQGQCGSCWAFASMSAIEAAQCLANDGKIAPTYSKQQIVSCERRSFGCGGGAALYAMEYARDNGVCLESSYPYTSAETHNAAECLNSCASHKSGITDIVKLSAGNESALIEALQKQPVVVSVISNNPAWKQYKSGVMSSCDNQKVDHAVLAVGYDATTIKIKNSWGTDWGEDGYIRISRSTQDMGTCGVLTDMLYPKV